MRLVAFTGGKGGVGKSLLAANTAIAMAMNGRRTVLFDADLQLANIDVMLGLKPEHNLQSVVLGEKSLRDILLEGPGGVKIVTGGSALNGLMNAGPKRMATFLDQLESLNNVADIVVFDTGSGLDQRVMTFLRIAHEVVLVTTPDPTSVTDAYATLKVLLKKQPDVAVSVLANFVRNEDEARHIFATLNAISREFLGYSLRSLGHVHADLEALQSIRSRKALVVNQPESMAARDIRRVATALAAGPAPLTKLNAAS